ncbi:MAG: SRPBCC domain-containing protein [Methanobacteriota archaeon]|nr:MAG: SRPBCC domain-containing protein [Euryarchaeota archaeon]
MAGPLESPGGGGPPAKPSPPKQPSVVLLADAKITVLASIPIVFEALVNPEQLGVWWAQDVEVEAEESGRYEGTTSEGRVEGTITAIDGPGRLSYTWPIAREGGPIETSVAYELTPKGPATFVRLLHRSPQPVAGDWNDLWRRALESLKAFLEGAAPISE